MATHIYFCEEHDQIFEIQVPFSRKHPPKRAFCTIGLSRNPSAMIQTRHTGIWRPSAAYFIVKEGTGAFKRSPINHD